MGLWVLHKCDVRNCVNPDHLYLGTHADNMRDKKLRKRSRTTSKYGIKRHNPKLNNRYVRTIRDRVKYGYTHRAVAHDFGVCRQMIGEIINNQSWVGI